MTKLVCISITGGTGSSPGPFSKPNWWKWEPNCYH